MVSLFGMVEHAKTGRKGAARALPGRPSASRGGKLPSSRPLPPPSLASSSSGLKQSNAASHSVLIQAEGSFTKDGNSFMRKSRASLLNRMAVRDDARGVTSATAGLSLPMVIRAKRWRRQAHETAHWHVRCCNCLGRVVDKACDLVHDMSQILFALVLVLVDEVSVLGCHLVTAGISAAPLRVAAMRILHGTEQFHWLLFRAATPSEPSRSPTIKPEPSLARHSARSPSVGNL